MDFQRYFLLAIRRNNGLKLDLFFALRRWEFKPFLFIASFLRSFSAQNHPDRKSHSGFSLFEKSEIWYFSTRMNRKYRFPVPSQAGSGLKRKRRF